MEQAEVEMLVGELETRLDRLRSLYDQYFMGIERLEPLVPRKDVERRMATLRKEQIRNTGLRFKFQTLTQRFNTYQTYWIRISRQIEQGTYRRDVMRATARFGVDPTKERDAEADVLPKSPPPVRAPDEPMEELLDGSDLLQSLDVEPISPPAQASKERFASAVKLDIDDLADPFEEHDPFPKPGAPPTAPEIRPRSLGLNAPEERDLEAKQRTVPAAQVRIAPRPTNAQMPSEEPRVVIVKRASSPDESERLASGSAPRLPPSGASLKSPGLPPNAGPSLGRVASRPPATAADGSAPRATLLKSATLPGPNPPGSSPQKPTSLPTSKGPVITVSARPPMDVPLAPPSGAVLSRPGPPTPVNPAASSAPVLARPAGASARPPVVAPPPRPLPPAPAPVLVGDLSGDRFGQIYSKYVETRRAHNEPTHAITRDALAKQLAESTQRLKQKHGGKPIDFEVVVKDGKTILRPVVK